MPEPISAWTVPFALTLFRVGGLMLVAPLFSSRTIPLPVRAGLAFLLVLLLTPVVPVPPEGVAFGPTLIIGEIFVGLGVGLGSAVLLAGAELAGEILAVQTGLSGATTLNPLTGVGTGVLSQLLGLFALLLLLATGAHLVLIEALVVSYESVPPGALADLEFGVVELTSMFGLLFSTGLKFAAPIIAAVSVGYLALGILARTSPQMNMLAVAFPLQIGLGLLVLAAVLPLAATFYSAWPDHVAGLANRFFLAVGGG
ncbi:MAG: flagellar biosynthetic protein FliR [Gemmatimonadetes bacterium]|nr:flagellar biosynthetic protein FliR [Gemmatimonadota bacterium]